MSNVKILFVILCGWMLPSAVFGQLDTNRFPFTVRPHPGTNIVSESTNALTLTIGNWAVTNIVTETDGEGNEVTTTNLIPLLTNLNVTATYPGAGTNIIRLRLLDSGQAPDKVAMDGTFTTNFITPYILEAYFLPLTFTVRGLDVSVTNDAGEPIQPMPFTNIFDVEYFIFPRPGNDKLTNAFKLASAGGVAQMTNNYASIEGGEPKHAKVATMDASIWWMWSSPVNTNVLVDTGGSGFNPVLAVYTGNAMNQLVEVASATNDVVNKLKAYVNFDAVAGVTYRIAVSGKDSTTNSQGWVRLRVAPGAAPDTHPPTVSIDTPTRSSLVTSEVLSLLGSAKEPVGNDSGISNVLVQVNSEPPVNATGSDSWSISVTLPAGTNVIRAYAVDYAGNIGPADSVVVRYINPTNDLFTSAGRLTGVGGVAEASVRLATRELGEPLHAGNAGGHSVWYYWRAPSNGELRLTTSGSTYDTLLGLYIGSSLTNLIELAGNDDAYDNSEYSEIVYGVVSNQLYYVAVDGYGGDTGDLFLQYAFVPPTPGQYYNLTALSSPGGTVSPPSGTYRSGARVLMTAIPETNFEFAGWMGDVTSLNNPMTLVMSQDYKVSASFRLVATTNAVVTDGFESGNFRLLSWATPSTARWSVQTNVVSRGKYAARSGVISDGQSCSLTLQTNLLNAAASFDVRVSSENGWDYLEFYLNGSLVQRWSGEVAWTNFVFNVPYGLNQLEWKYVKDGNFTGGQDAAFIDNVFLPLDLQSTPVGAFALLLNYLPDGQVQITIKGEPNRDYTLEASSDLADWVDLGTRSSESGIVQFLDREAAGYVGRFYRALVP